MKRKRFKIKNKVFLWPGMQAAWHFIYIDGLIKDKIVKAATTHHMGMIRVQATLGKTVWETSLFPNKKENCYIVALKKSVRQAEGIFDGDEVTIELELVH